MLVFLFIILVIIVVLLLFIIITFFFFAIDLFLDLPYVATKKDKIETIIKLARIKPKETVVDLGSGDGRLIFAAARAGAHAIGYEINPFLVVLTRIKAHLLLLREKRSNLSTSHSGERSDSRIDSGQARLAAKRARMTGRVTIKRQNLWKADIAAADVIFVYGRQKSMSKFEDFVFKNARPGTRIIVNTNPFLNKKPLKSENGIFLYKV